MRPRATTLVVIGGVALAAYWLINKFGGGFGFGGGTGDEWPGLPSTPLPSYDDNNIILPIIYDSAPCEIVLENNAIYYQNVLIYQAGQGDMGRALSGVLIGCNPVTVRMIPLSNQPGFERDVLMTLISIGKAYVTA